MNFQEDNALEIQRCNLTVLIMMIKVLGVKNVLSVDWMSLPVMETFLHGFETLYASGVFDREAELTIWGKEMYVFVVVVVVLLIHCVNRVALQSGCEETIGSISVVSVQ